MKTIEPKWRSKRLFGSVWVNQTLAIAKLINGLEVVFKGGEECLIIGFRRPYIIQHAYKAEIYKHGSNYACRFVEPVHIRSPVLAQKEYIMRHDSLVACLPELWY